MDTRPYTPPEGTFDLPYTYAFDASQLTNGKNYLNQFVYIQGGYGDFGVRRVVGLKRILAADGTGRFQIMRASQGVYSSSAPVQAPNTPETASVPEEWYPELGQIGFDLYGINLPAPAGTGQLAFQGVRRQKGSNPLIGYKEDPRTFTYIAEGNLTQVASANARVVTYTPIDNYDFLLYQIMIFQNAPGTPATQNLGGENEAELTLTSTLPGTAGNGITITANPAPGNNLPLVITVIGTAVSVQLATDGTGSPTPLMTGNFVAAQLNGTPAVSALFTSLVTASGSEGFPINGANPPFVFGGGTGGAGIIPITSPICSLQVFDQNQVAISNEPILDIFYNGAPGTPYENGAVVPPLMYRRNTQVEIDFYSQITNPALLPTSVVVYLIGRKLYPCA